MSLPPIQEQHDFIELAKRQKWDLVFEKLDAKPQLINVQPCNRWSALHQAALRGKKDEIQRLLELRADIDARVPERGTPWDVAAKSVKFMLEQAREERELQAREERELQEEHDFLDSARSCDWDSVRVALGRSPRLLNVQPARRWSALHQAAFNGNAEIVNFLLGLHAEVGLTDRDGQTALQVAAEDVKPLLEAASREASAARAKAAWGRGKWQMNTETFAHWIDLEESFPADGPYFACLHENGPSSGIFHLEPNEVCPRQEANVDFSSLTVTLRGWDKRGMIADNLCLPLRRVDSTGTQTHPTPGSKHPLAEQVEREKNSGGSFLTNEFFFQAFCQAVEQGGGTVDFTSDDLFDFQFNEDWQALTVDAAPLERRGGVLYRTPAGWKRFAIKCRDNYADNKWLNMKGEEGEWAVAYHGTSMKVVPLIIKNGFRVGAGQGAAKCKDVRTNKQVGSGIYCTPNLQTVECYANGAEDKASENKEAAATIGGHTLFFALQCRVRPGAILRPDRHFARNNDEEVMGVDGVFEWVVNDPRDIRPYAILVRDKAGSDHRPLGKLIGKDAQGRHKWNVDHKPLPWGSFSHIEGRAGTHDEIQNSYLQAKRALAE